jgi:hypothetical protein
VGTRTSGSAGGGGQTTARKRGTAARLRPTIEITRRTSRNVKRWQSGDMCLRSTAAGMLEAEQPFRKIIGYSDPRQARHSRRARPHRPARGASPHDHRAGRYARHRLTMTPGTTAVTNFHDGRDNLGTRVRPAMMAKRRQPRRGQREGGVGLTERSCTSVSTAAGSMSTRPSSASSSDWPSSSVS